MLLGVGVFSPQPLPEGLQHHDSLQSKATSDFLGRRPGGGCGQSGPKRQPPSWSSRYARTRWWAVWARAPQGSGAHTRCTSLSSWSAMSSWRSQQLVRSPRGGTCHAEEQQQECWEGHQQRKPLHDHCLPGFAVVYPALFGVVTSLVSFFCQRELRGQTHTNGWKLCSASSANPGPFQTWTHKILGGKQGVFNELDECYERNIPAHPLSFSWLAHGWLRWTVPQRIRPTLGLVF